MNLANFMSRGPPCVLSENPVARAFDVCAKSGEAVGMHVVDKLLVCHGQAVQYYVRHLQQIHSM